MSGSRSSERSGCCLCPRNCGADRADGKTGFCGVPETVYVARAALHFWEEPCISGTDGSGAVFFSGCPLRCVYCQNYELAHARAGIPVTIQRLAEIFLELQEQGANNINLVTPTQYTPAIVRALTEAKRNGLNIPAVYNCGGYESVSTLRMLDGLVDIYLTDFKYIDTEAAAKYSGARDYPEVARKALDEMTRQIPSSETGPDGIMKKGVIVRHLILPGCTGDSIRALDFIAEKLPKGTPVSLMRQYTPEPWCTVPGLDRRVTDAEYKRVLTHFEMLGLPGYTQEKEAADGAYTPNFDGTGV